MIYFVSNYDKNFELTNINWNIIKNLIFHLDEQEDAPLLNYDHWVDMDLFDGFCLSSRTTSYLSEIIDKSLCNGKLEEFKNKFDILFSTCPIFEFSDFLNSSDGLIIRL